MKNAVDVTIAIVNYKTPDLLEKCLKSIYKYTRGVSFVVYVVDNASGDRSVNLIRSKFPKVKLIANSKNLYAAVGLNQILKQVKSPYTLITEPGVELSTDAISMMFLYLEKNRFPRSKGRSSLILAQNKKIAACSCRQEDEKRTVDSTCSRFPTPIIEFFNSSVLSRFIKNNKLIKWYRYGNWERDSTRLVDVASDIFMLARSDILKKVNYYDTKMDLFFIDNDLCLKIKKAGYNVCHLGNIEVKHLRGRSTAKFSGSDMFKFYEHDMLYYYKKHFGLMWFLFLWVTYRFDWIFWKLKSV